MSKTGIKELFASFDFKSLKGSNFLYSGFPLKAKSLYK